MTNGLLTKHLSLFVDDSTQIPEDLVQLVNAGLNFPNFCFTFLDEGFLVSKLGGRQLCLEDLSLALFDGTIVLRPVSGAANVRTNQRERARL